MTASNKGQHLVRDDLPPSKPPMPPLPGTTQTVTWKPIRGASYYESADFGGRVRSVPRTINGRSYEGTELSPSRTGTSRYWQVKITFDDGKQRKLPVGVLVLLAHGPEKKPGQECCHADDNPDNNDLSNLRWDWPDGNREDRRLNSPPPKPKPVPVRECVICGDPFTGNGRRCHPCVVGVGVKAAAMLRDGVRLQKAADDLGYPSLDGLHELARRYGGYGQSWSRRVRARLAAWLAGGDAA